MAAVRLTDQQMRGFIRDGYAVVKTQLPREVHRDIWDQTESLFESEGNPGNNLMARIPDMRLVFDDPAVDGALAGVLGDSYYMHPHRHCHYRPPHSEGQQIHKDSFTRRRHRTRWILAMYYPQDTTVDMGPTAVIPGTQYNNWLRGPIGTRTRSDSTEGEVPMEVDAGTVLIVHYDIWHRGMGNASDKKRYMMKFMFTRMEEPWAPSWDSREREWVSEGDGGRDAMWSEMWRWHSGAGNGDSGGDGGSGEIRGLIDNLRVDSEAACLEAAYRLGSMGQASLGPLMDTLRHESEAVRRNASYGLSTIGAGAAPALVEACGDSNTEVRSMAVETLADMGPAAADAVPSLVKALDDESVLVRRQAADALGTAGQLTPKAVPALAGVLNDEDELLRRNAALALARIGPGAEEATQALRASLRDEDRYVRGKASHALRRIGTPEAQEALIHFLTTSQWCYSTTADSLY